jgi:hypothetical protein
MVAEVFLWTKLVLAAETLNPSRNFITKNDEMVPPVKWQDVALASVKLKNFDIDPKRSVSMT